MPGQIINRYGPPKGHYLSTPGYSTSQRGMVQGTDTTTYTRYLVQRHIPVQYGPAAPVPTFNAVGGAPQYYLGSTVTVGDLVIGGFLSIFNGFLNEK